MIKMLVIKAVYDQRWNPSIHFDGCTFIQDNHHPCLWCFVHDYLWITGQGGIDSDKLMRYLAIEMGTSRFKANIMYFVVRVAWLIHFKYKRKPSEITHHFENALKLL